MNFLYFLKEIDCLHPDHFPKALVLRIKTVWDWRPTDTGASGSSRPSSWRWGVPDRCGGTAQRDRMQVRTCGS
jgi:hypothetical protein